MKLKGKTAVVSGASSGLGMAIAQALVAKEVRVYALARNKEKLQKLEADLGDLLHPVSLDITDEAAIAAWVGETFTDTKPDILINNAGVGSFGKIDELPTSAWNAMINTNLNGMYYLTSSLIPLMKEKDTQSYVINIGSILGIDTRSEGTAYCASKFGARGFSEALLKEVRSDNIKVTTLHPGSIETSFFKSSGIEKHSNMLQAKDLADTVIHLLETPANMLISELVIRPLDSRKPR